MTLILKKKTTNNKHTKEDSPIQTTNTHNSKKHETEHRKTIHEKHKKKITKTIHHIQLQQLDTNKDDNTKTTP